jgi:hypothetical protein
MPADSLISAVARAVEAEHGWMRDEFELRELNSIQLAPCSFYTATHRRAPMHFPPTYATLADGRVLGDADGAAWQHILRDCGVQPDRTPAISVAEVFARFHPQVAPGHVLRDRSEAPTAIGRLEAEGRGFAPPVFERRGDEAVLHFFLMNYEADLLYEVRAERDAAGQWSVDRTRVGRR